MKEEIQNHILFHNGMVYRYETNHDLSCEEFYLNVDAQLSPKANGGKK